MRKPNPYAVQVDALYEPVDTSDDAVLFEVTAVIGRVTRGTGPLSPREAAFLLIARNSTPGPDITTYRFPNEDGTTNCVTVETDPSTA